MSVADVSPEEERDLMNALLPRLAERAAVAHHEAGHATMGFRTGCAIGPLRLVRLGGDVWGGRVTTRPRSADYRLFVDRHLAGDIAGWRYLNIARPCPHFRPLSDADVGEEDAAQAYQTALQYYVRPGELIAGTALAPHLERPSAITRCAAWARRQTLGRMPRDVRGRLATRCLRSRYRRVMREIWDEEAVWSAIRRLADHVAKQPTSKRTEYEFGRKTLYGVEVVEVPGAEIIEVLTSSGLLPRQRVPHPIAMP
jgi:hypothetical protein